MAGRSARFSIDRLAGLALLLAVAWYFWNSVFLYPLRLLVTFFHEVGHALAALITGGRVSEIALDPNGSGFCKISGGMPLLVIPAGYIGSMAAGCLLLITAFRTHLDKFVTLALGLALLLVTALYIRTPFALGFCLFMGAVFVFASWKFSEETNELMLSFIGVTSCLEALFDIRTLMQYDGSTKSDAVRFSELIPLPPMVWAGLWGLFSFLVLWFTLKTAMRKSR
jgi:hypothetical protein